MSFNSNAWRRFSYTLWAPFYDALARAFAPRRRRAIELLNLHVGERVLIVGAGTGLDLEMLRRDVRITATDLTPAMLQRLRARARRLGLGVEARVMDGQALDLPDASFDAVILNLIVAVIPDPVRCLRETQRVLRPGGRAVVFDKFLPDEAEPPLLFRLLNPVMSCFGTNVDRRLGPLVAQTQLRIAHQESAGFRGLYRIALLEKG